MKVTLEALDRAEAEEEGRGGLRFESIGNFKARAPDYLVEGVVEADALAVMFGESAAGKSFVSLSLGLSIATGRPFAGCSIRRRGPVLYAAGEGRGGLIRRAHAWAKANQVDLQGVPFLLADRGAGLIDETQVAELRDAIRSASRLHGTPALLVVDTWARAIAPGSENATEDTGAAVAVLDELRRTYPGMTCLVVHHSGKGDKVSPRGSTALRSAADAVYLIAKAKHGPITMTADKCKDGPEPPPMGFELEDVALGVDEQGRAIGSAWARPCQVGEEVEELRPVTGKNQVQALQALEALCAEQQANLFTGGLDPSGARVSIKDWEERSGLDRKRFPEAKAGLEARGLIVIESPYVRPARPMSEVRGVLYTPPDTSDFGHASGASNSDAIRTIRT